MKRVGENFAVSRSALRVCGQLCGLALFLTQPGGIAQNTATKKDAGTEYLDNGSIRIGVNLKLGGAITYLARSGNHANLINSHDWGRQIQMSHYSGPIPFTPNGKKPQETWAGLGWNPIQSGDAFGNRSRLLEYKNDGKTIYVRCVPMQWPLNNEPGDCTFENWIRLEGNTAWVRSRMNNHRTDKTQYTGRDQELPAIYTNGLWYRLMTYTGDKPFSNGELTQIPATFPWSGWQATENWAALVNDTGDGVGIWEPGVTTFLGGFAGKPGAGGPTDDPTGYIAPLRQEILDHNITYEYQYALIVGSLQEIRSTAYVFHRNAFPQDAPTYRFVKDRQHWRYVNAVDTGWPIQGELKVLLDANNPQMIGPTGFWKANRATKLVIEAAYTTTQTQGRVFWKRHDAHQFSPERSLAFALIPDGNFHIYTIDLTVSPGYRGAITGLRLDPVLAGKRGDYVRIRSISLQP